MFGINRLDLRMTPKPLSGARHHILLISNQKAEFYSSFLPINHNHERSGRAVAQPVLTNTLHRRDPTSAARRISPRDFVIRNVNDMRRSLDFLISRGDIDATKLAYFGYSWGGTAAPFLLALEPRLGVAVLNSAGFSAGKSLPEIEPRSYVPRVQRPVLMLNGEYDNVFPLEASARPFFDLLGTPADLKKLVVTPGGHFVPRETLVRETLDWLDRYLGPVK